ncbi:hypothetical protein LRR18_14315 [Mangrovimonas sp. AS39]|nr:hypothetical protein [Mangrovimonas futianensis]MCF1192765.1 hypothetical protein [Mangrovimonas futianensis]
MTSINSKLLSSENTTNSETLVFSLEQEHIKIDKKQRVRNLFISIGF